MYFVIFTEISCGKNESDEIKFIIGAKNDLENNPVGHWPWMASIGFNDANNNWNHKCGATLISDQHFLTAAHCVNGEYVKSLYCKWFSYKYFDLKIISELLCHIGGHS